MLNELFPGGAAAITRLDYVEQSTEIDSILGPLEKKYADLVKELGLVPYVKTLRTLNDRFRALLQKDRPSEVTPSTVRAAANKGQESLLQAVVMILGKHPTDVDADVKARQNLLGPIIDQNEAIGVYLRARRSVRDVDPETGEERPEEPVGPAEPVVEPVVEPDPGGGDSGGGSPDA